MELGWLEQSNGLDRLRSPIDGSALELRQAGNYWFLESASRTAFPVIDGIPVLLAPEATVSGGPERAVGPHDERYAEAYEEMEYYNNVSRAESENIETSQAYEAISQILACLESERPNFAFGGTFWLDSRFDLLAQRAGYRNLGNPRGRTLLQVGGRGIHAVKFLLAGAESAWLVTPMLLEAKAAVSLAQAAGVASRLRVVCGVAEEMPFASSIFDAIYAGGSAHHMVTDLAFPEIARLLRPGGRFSAVDPWRAPFYGIGTRVLGKREPEVSCRPLDPDRVAPLAASFPNSYLHRYGCITRYPLLALNKLGLRPSLNASLRIANLDERLAIACPALRILGSSASICAERTVDA